MACALPPCHYCWSPHSQFQHKLAPASVIHCHDHTRSRTGSSPTYLFIGILSTLSKSHLVWLKLTFHVIMNQGSLPTTRSRHSQFSCNISHPLPTKGLMIPDIFVLNEDSTQQHCQDSWWEVIKQWLRAIWSTGWGCHWKTGHRNGTKGWTSRFPPWSATTGALSNWSSSTSEYCSQTPASHSWWLLMSFIHSYVQLQQVAFFGHLPAGHQGTHCASLCNQDCDEGERWDSCLLEAIKGLNCLCCPSSALPYQPLTLLSSSATPSKSPGPPSFQVWVTQVPLLSCSDSK